MTEGSRMGLQKVVGHPTMTRDEADRLWTLHAPAMRPSPYPIQNPSSSSASTATTVRIGTTVDTT